MKMRAARCREVKSEVCSSGLLLTLAALMCMTGFDRDQSAAPFPDFTLPQVRGSTFRLHSQPAQPVLLAFLQTVPDTADTTARSQVVFLSSMAQQYGQRGLRVAVIDASALVNHRPPDHASLVNVSYDWQMNFPLLEDGDNQITQRFGVMQIPTLVLLAPDGRICQRWQGATGPAQLAQGIERLLNGPLGRLPGL
jgi:peroxiredoxin